MKKIKSVTVYTITEDHKFKVDSLVTKIDIVRLQKEVNIHLYDFSNKIISSSYFNRENVISYTVTF